MCKDCPRRKLACQDSCEDMARDRARREQIKARKNAERRITDAVVEMTLERNKRWR